MVKKELISRIVPYLERRGVKKISVFGAYARGEENPDSDMDILVEFSGRKSPLDLVKIERELSEFLGINVELLTEKAISPYLIDRIKKEAQLISV